MGKRNGSINAVEEFPISAANTSSPHPVSRPKAALPIGAKPARLGGGLSVAI